MTIISTTRRIVEAVLAALGVVFGIVPDPTRTPVPVPVPVRDDYPRR